MLIQFQESLGAVQEMIRGFFELLPRLALGLLIFVLFWIAAAAVRRFVRSLARRAGRKEGVSLVLSRLARWATVFAGFLVALSAVSPSLDAATLIQVLGISSVAIGFAFSDILQNFLAGILILLSEPFRIGDQIVYDDFEGTVEEVSIRETVLRTYDGRRVVIPNGQLYTDAITVNTAHDLRRSQYDFGIDYGDDAAKARDVIAATVREAEGVVEEPAPQVFVWELGGSSVNLRARWWTEPGQASVVEVHGEVIESVKRALEDSDIDIPFPIRDVRITEGGMAPPAERDAEEGV